MDVGNLPQEEQSIQTWCDLGFLYLLLRVLKRNSTRCSLNGRWNTTTREVRNESKRKYCGTLCKTLILYCLKRSKWLAWKINLSFWCFRERKVNFKSTKNKGSTSFNWMAWQRSGNQVQRTKSEHSFCAKDAKCPRRVNYLAIVWIDPVCLATLVLNRTHVKLSVHERCKTPT